MPRPEGELGPGSPAVMEFAAGLRLLREKAGHPGYRELARRAHFSATTLSEAAGGRRLPTLAVTLAYVNACGGDPAEWTARWQDLARTETGGGPSDPVRAGEDDMPYQGLLAYGPERAEWFFGREDVVADLRHRLAHRRFVALFGASGSGKSSVLRAGLVPAATTGGPTPGATTGGPAATANGSAPGTTTCGPAATADDPTPGTTVNGSAPGASAVAAGGPAPAVLVLTPGPDPLGELAVQFGRPLRIPAGTLRADLAADPSRLHLVVRQLLADASPESELWLVVDQFEEIFTLCRDADGRAGFVAALLTAVHTPGSRLRVVLGVRADFYGRCAELPELVGALADAQVLIGPMTATQIRDAVVRPAERAGAMVEGALVSTIVAQVAGRVGALPVASHVLLETWRRRRGNAVTLAGYRAAGGVDGAVAQSAERIWQEFTVDQRRVARHLLLRLVEIGTGDEPDAAHRVDRTELPTARRMGRSELDETDPPTLGVLERLAAARLVTVDDRSVRLAHEALLDAWPRLRRWLEEDLDGVRVHRRLTQAAASWRSLDHDPGGLYRGLALSRARAWAQAHPESLTGPEREFLDASRAAEDAVARRRRNRRRLVGGALAGVVAVVTVLAGVAVVQAGQARDQRDLAVHRQLVAGARAQLPRDPQLAFMLARMAYDLRPDTEAETVFRQATLHWRGLGSRQILDTRRVLVTRLKNAALTPDGRYVAVAAPDGTVWWWDGTEPSGPVPLPDPGRDMHALAISPDGRWVASGHRDPAVRLWDTADLGGGPVLLSGHRGAVLDVRFSPDGRWLATGDGDGTVRIWDVSRRPRARVLPHAGRGGVYSLAWSPQGRRLAAATVAGPARVWDLTAPERPPTELADSTGSADGLLFSPDGRRVAATDNVAGEGSSLRIWNVTGGDRPVLLGRLRGVLPAVFSPDGRRLITKNSYGVIGVWDTAGTNDPLPLRGHAGAVCALTLTPDGRLVSVGEDGTVRVWDVGGAYDPSVFRPHAGLVHAARFSPDGRHVASAGIYDGTVRVWPATDRADPGSSGAGSPPPENGSPTGTASPTPDGTGPAVLAGHAGMTMDVAFAPDGTRLASLDAAGTVRLWGWPGGQLRNTFLAGPASRITFDPTGRRLLTSGGGGITLWDRIDNQPPEPVRLGPAGTGAAFSPDGRRLATGADDGTVRLHDVTGDDPRPPTDRPVLTLAGATEPVSSVSFSPDGTRVAALARDSTIRIWPATGGAPTVVLASAGQGNATTRLAYTPGGRHLALLGGEELTGIQLWPAAGGTTPVTLRTLGPGPLGFTFAPDGERIATVHSDGSVRVWRCDVCGPVDRLLATADTRATRPFTPDERRTFLLDDVPDAGS
ncbi:nSTAND1 domain-containing NTPase [Plantactinospora sonchi]|uniref:HTH cro/C1-type domain-containing protein n=1 Tax=Plantactinospora sonchi TaxID=1544735 RepID=A0ABU7RKT3_9ACTN